MVVAQLLDRAVIAKFSCFQDNPVVAIERLEAGLSQECYRVQTKKGEFLAKHFKSNQAFKKELTVTKCKSPDSVIPQLNAFKENWLISEYLQGSMLSELGISFEEKLDIVLPLLKKFYLLSANMEKQTELFGQIDLVDLVKQMSLAVSNDVDKMLLIDEVLTRFKSQQYSSGYESVLCHGDLNFNNIMYHHSIDDWRLFDFESCHLSHIEYDIAMLLAVNEYPITNLGQIHNNLLGIFPQLSIDLVTRYYVICLLINGLWYQQQTSEKQSLTIKEKYQKLSAIQFRLLNDALYS